MRALIIQPTGNGGKLVLGEVPEPSPGEGELLVEAVALGICGTDRELANRAPRPPAFDRSDLILGHESLGRVLTAPAGSGIDPGDLVVGIVRRPDPIPCMFCAEGQFDLCENGRFTERGISGLDGFGSEQFRLEADYAVRIDPRLGLAGVLLEPASVVAKAWEQLDRVVRRPYRRALVLGAGPIGLLAALLGKQRGVEMHVVDQVEHGPKPRQVSALNAEYYTRVDKLTGTFDAVIECCGALVGEAIQLTAPGGAACLVGGIDPLSASSVNLGELSRDLMIGNRTVFGIVNSNRRHFEAAHAALQIADQNWLRGLLTDCIPLEDWRSAFEIGPETIKSVITFKPLPRCDRKKNQ